MIVPDELERADMVATGAGSKAQPALPVVGPRGEGEPLATSPIEDVQVAQARQHRVQPGLAVAVSAPTCGCQKVPSAGWSHCVSASVAVSVPP